MVTKDKFTTMHGLYNNRNPSAATFTKLDVMRDSLVLARNRIYQAKLPAEYRTVSERIMLIQFIIDYILGNNCSLTEAVNHAQRIFCWRRQEIFTVVNDYLRGDSIRPGDKVRAKRGRGSELFIERYADRFFVLKRHHCAEILEYVRTANSSRGGMVTAGRIQAHLLQKYDTLFKKSTIYYALKKRLKLKYAYAGKPKIVFSAARKRSAIIFCTKYDEALKLQAAGTHVIVYMDESYCRGNHACSRTWNESGGIPNRPRGKGALMIIVHAITKDGFLLPEGVRLDVDEWKAGRTPTCEMVFRSKYAVKHHVRDYHDTMDGPFFMYWVQNRLTSAFQAKYPGKKMILVLDNAPYHHTLVDNGFRPDGMSKESICERLATLPRK